MHILFHLGFFLFDFVTKICLFITYGVLEIKSGGDTWAPGHSMGQVRTYHKVQHRQIESGGILAGRIKEDFLGEVACVLDLRIWKD